jgi:O-antigen ligase
MKHLWLVCFPLLFIPNFGLSHATAFGTLEVSDWLVVPLILLLLIASPARFPQRISQLRPFLWAFLIWALLSTLSIHFRYDYSDDVPIALGSCLKLARLAIYVSASLLIARALHHPQVREKWLWSLVGALFMLSIGLLAGGHDRGGSPTESLEGYKSYNVIIVCVAILASYIVGLLIHNVGARRWRKFAGLVVLFAAGAVVLSTSLSSHGRGGWVAFAVGFGYVLWKRTQAVKAFAIVGILGLFFLAAYHTVITFQSLVDATFSTDPGSNSEQFVDDGSRVDSWKHEGSKFLDAPLFGTGFYHRGGQSGLWETGSHNFFIQMFLETGIVGGLLVIAIFAVAWRQAGHAVAVQNKIATPTRAALITAIVGGMSGEYYYGGIGVLVLLAVLALTGSLPYEQFLYVENGGRFRPMKWRVAV